MTTLQAIEKTGTWVANNPKYYVYTFIALVGTAVLIGLYNHGILG